MRAGRQSRGQHRELKIQNHNKASKMFLQCDVYLLKCQLSYLSFYPSSYLSIFSSHRLCRAATMQNDNTSPQVTDSCETRANKLQLWGFKCISHVAFTVQDLISKSKSWSPDMDRGKLSALIRRSESNGRSVDVELQVKQVQNKSQLIKFKSGIRLSSQLHRPTQQLSH